MQIKACDRCSSTQNVKTFFVVIGRGTDAAGSTDDFGDNVDLCASCCYLTLMFILKARDYKLNKLVLDWMLKAKAS